MYLIWIGIVVALAFIELITLNFTTVWFVISGIIATILSFFINNFIIQFLIFIILGLLFLHIIKKYLIKKYNKLNLNKLVGKKGKVIKEIRKNHNGKVSIDNKQLIAYADKKIMVNKTVEVLLINGLKIKVKEVKK